MGDNLKQEVLDGSFWHGATNLIQKFGGLIFTVVLTRFLLPEGFGLYNLAISITSLFFIFSQSGPDRTLGRYISASLKKKEKQSAYFSFVFKIKAILVFIAMALLIIFAYPLSVHVLKNEKLFAPLLLSAIFFFFTSFDQFFSFLFFAVKKIKYRAYKEIIFQFLRIILILVVFLVIYKEPSVEKSFLVLIFATFVALIYIFFKVKSNYPYLIKSKHNLSQIEKKKVLSFMWLMSLTAISIIALGNIDTLMLGFLLKNTISIGLYKSAFLLVSSISSLLAFSSVLMPFFVQLDGKKLEIAFRKSLKYLMLISIPGAFGLAILGNYFLVLIYGREYLGAILSLYFLAPLLVITIQTGLYRELFASKEKPELLLKASLLVIVLNVLLNYVLIKFLSKYSFNAAIAGAAIATTFSWLVYVFGIGVLAKREIGVGYNFDVLIKPIFSSVIMSLVLIFLKRVLEINIISGILLVSSGFLVYLLTMILIGGIREEDYFIIRILKDRIKK